MPKEKFFDSRKPFASKRPETHEEWQARMGGEVLAVVRSGLYLDFRFLDQALSALTPTADERCGVLATDGTILCYQPSALLRLYQKNPKYLNRLYLHTVFHCIFRHLWLRGKRDKRLWDLACDIAVENVIDHAQVGHHETVNVGVRLVGDDLVVEVRDMGVPWPDRVLNGEVGVEMPPIYSERGRGMAMMRALMDDVTPLQRPNGGKTLRMTKRLLRVAADA